MIRSLEGVISSLGENSLVVVVNNIGYLVHTPTTRHQYVPGENIFIFTHLVVRETVLDLYGFLERDELSFFELLLNVPKIGPKSALQVLCQADISLLSSAIMEQDADHLHKMSGIGKKTAANIVTALASKVEALNMTNHTAATTITHLSQSQIDAIDALITLGYDPQEARTYVVKQDKGDDAKTLIQAVLRQIPIP